MSVYLDDASIAQFSEEVHVAFQASGLLHTTVRFKSKVVGSTYRFPKMSGGVAQPVIPQAEVVPMGIVHTNATATLTNWVASEYTDLFAQSKTNIDERMELGGIIGNAMGRRRDQIIIDALISGVNATEVSDDLGGTNSGFNLEKILRAKRLMDVANVPDDGNRFLLLHAASLEAALQVTAITSADYNILKPLVDGTVKKHAGFNIITIGNRPEGGLPISSNIRTNLAWHKSAIGYAEGIPQQVKVSYENSRLSYLANGIFTGGAVAIDSDGIFKINTYES